ncbi:unnamed protein product, partial [Ectocarpus sp. 12 AP-2014]
MSNRLFQELSLLYVEDEPLISLDAMNTLEKCDFKKLECVYTLKSATLAASSSFFDCAILDIRLDKGLNSIDLGKELAQKGTMVILASGNASDKENLERMGFLTFFTKPYDIFQIISEIER